jgi:hypothetical protein
VASAGAAASLFVVSGALAQVGGVVIQTRRDLNTGAESAVPGLPAATLTAIANANAANGTNGRVVWNEPSNANPGFSPNAGNPVIDAAGNIYFPGTMAAYSFTDPDTLSVVFATGTTGNFSANGVSNNRGVFFSSAASGWATSAITMIARDGSTNSTTTNSSGTGPILGGTNVPLTGVPAGSVLNGTGNVAGLGTSVAVSANGMVMFNSLVAPYVNSTTGTGTTIGASFFTGNNSGFAASGLNADALTGTSGATFSLGATQSTGSTSINNSGQFAFAATTAGGDSVTSGVQQNNSGIWRFSSTGNVKVMRRADAAPGAVDGSATSNAAFGAAPVNTNIRINSGGDVLFPETLATTSVPAGFTAATAAQSGVLYVKPSSGALQLIGQTGTPSTGAGSLYYLNSSAFGISSQMFNNSGEALFNAKYNTLASSPNPNPSITANVNDQGIMKWTSGGGTTALFQTGSTPVPGVAGATTFRDLGGISNNQTRLNNLGHYSFSASMTAGGTITTSNDTGLWLGNGTVGGAQLIARGGDLAPGLGGLFFGNAFFGVVMNNTDMIIFQNTPNDGAGHNGPATLFAWGPGFGLIPLFAQGNTTLLGANYPISSGLASYNAASNGDGGVACLNDNGQFTFFANSSGAGGAFGVNNVLMEMQIPAPGAGALALLGLAAVARRRRR